jgi:hypothetical protein
VLSSSSGHRTRWTASASGSYRHIADLEIAFISEYYRGGDGGADPFGATCADRLLCLHSGHGKAFGSNWRCLASARASEPHIQRERFMR